MKSKHIVDRLKHFLPLWMASQSERDKFTIELHGLALRWKNLDEDIHILNFFDNRESNPDNEIAAMFEEYRQLDLSLIAQAIGINKSLLRKYIYGIESPNDFRKQQIRTILNTIKSSL